MLVFVLAVMSAAPTGDKPLAAAVAKCDQARRLGLEMRLELALRAYDEALGLFAQAMAGSTQWTEQMALCFADRGAHAADLKRDALALSSFVNALTLAPHLVLSPRVYSPSVIALFQNAKQKVKTLPHSTITIVTTPPGARIEIDGTEVGSTPASPSLTACEHWLVVRKEGHEPVITSVIVVPGRVDKVELFLKPSASPAPGSGEPSPIAPSSDRAPNVTVETPASAPAASAPAALVVPAPLPSPSVPAGLAWLPFGVAQFLERRYLPGGLLLGAQVLLLAASTTAFAIIMADRRADGRFNNPARDQALQGVNLASAGLLLATGVIGAIDGELHRGAPAPAKRGD